MRNEFYLISEGAFDCLSLPFSFRKDEIFLIPFQTKTRALNEPVKPIQAKVQLVAHPVGVSQDACTRGIPGDGKPLRFCLEGACRACANPR